jgi:hypothetical protein
MEIIQNKIVVKLDKEERDNLIATIGLLDNMERTVPCDGCPFQEQCNRESDTNCLIRTIKQDLIYINNNCD